MMIPKSFRLGTKRYRIQLRLVLPARSLGEVYYDARYLFLALFRQVTPPPGFGKATPRKEGATYIAGAEAVRRSDSEMSETFWHEVTHAILHDMGDPLWKNEKFVTQFSKRLNQVIHTAKLS